MPLSLIGCTAAAIVVAMIVLFPLAGGLASAWAATGLGQTLLAGASALIGVIAGPIIHRRFFAAK
jgi:hypothetical protein